MNDMTRGRNWSPSSSAFEGALRRTTGTVRKVAEMLERDNPGDPIAAGLFELVAENKALLGDPDWRAAA